MPPDLIKPGLLLEQARLQLRDRQPGQALQTCQRVLETDVGNLDALLLLAEIYFTHGDSSNAVDVLNRARHHHPDNLAVLRTLAGIHIHNEELDPAASLLKSIVAANENHYAAWNDLGFVLHRKGQLQAALECYEKAALAPDDNGRALYNAGLVNWLLEENEAADVLFKRALEASPDSASVLNMLGVLQQNRGHYKAATDYFSRATAAEPGHVDAHRNLAEVLLVQGRFAEGWAEYEWRLRKVGHVIAASAGRPQWHQEPLQGKRVLVAYEQGIGDQVMFASCIPDLLPVAETCYLSCDPRLVGLFQRSFPGHTVLDAKTLAADPDKYARAVDIEVPLGSLPGAYRLQAGDFGDGNAYLVADPQQRRTRRKQLESLGDGPRIGVSWRGGSNPQTRHQRSVPLSDWAAILRCPGATFVNLQYGDCEQEIHALQRDQGTTVRQLDNFDPLRDLDDLAACIAELDLVISIDNATVHFAGALGTPAWILLPRAADWRWLQAGTASPWYRSVQLFRQSQAGDWSGVLQTIADQLNHRLRTSP